MKLCTQKKSENVDELNERINILENKIAGLQSGVIHKNLQNVDNGPANMAVDVQKVVKNANQVKTKKIVSGIPGKAIEAWPSVVDSFKQNGKIMLYTNLMNSTAKEINDMTVGIEFPKGLTAFGKTILEKPENMNELTKTISVQCGKEMRVKLIDNNDLKAQMSSEDRLVNEITSAIDMKVNIIDE